MLSGRAYLRRRSRLPALSRLDASGSGAAVLRLAAGRRVRGWPARGPDRRPVATVAALREAARARGRAAHDRPAAAGAPRPAQMRPARRGRLAGVHGPGGRHPRLPREPAPAAKAAPAITGPTFRNPVFGPAADPMVLDRGGTTRATSSMRPAVASRWRAPPTSCTGATQGSPCRPGPAWAQQTGDYNPWAPSVIEKPQPCPGSATGPCFVMFFTSKHSSHEPPGELHRRGHFAGPRRSLHATAVRCRPPTAVSTRAAGRSAAGTTAATATSTRRRSSMPAAPRTSTSRPATAARRPPRTLLARGTARSRSYR